MQKQIVLRGVPIHVCEKVPNDNKLYYDEPGSTHCSFCGEKLGMSEVDEAAAREYCQRISFSKIFDACGLDIRDAFLAGRKSLRSTYSGYLKTDVEDLIAEAVKAENKYMRDKIEYLKTRSGHADPSINAGWNQALIAVEYWLGETLSTPTPEGGE